jgi:hypothetical protein
VDLRGTGFNNAFFENTKFFSCDLRGAEFNGFIFKNCVFGSVKLSLGNEKFWAQYNDDECRLEKNGLVLKRQIGYVVLIGFTGVPILVSYTWQSNRRPCEIDKGRVPKPW